LIQNSDASTRLAALVEQHADRIHDARAEEFVDACAFAPSA
jgi:hypothetical protein